MKLLKKKALITGSNGLLGQKLVQAFLPEYDVYGVGTKPEALLHLKGYSYSRCDISKQREIVDLVKSIGPDIIVNSAAYTDVDGSEVNRDACWQVNCVGVKNLGVAAKRVDAFLVHISTDYVFDGRSGNYAEDSKPNPLGYYGRSKLAGENELILTGAESAIARTMVLYGMGSGLGPNFATWLIDKLSRGEAVNIVDDQFGHPTLVDDLAQGVKRIAKLRKQGVFHVTGRECDSRYGFAVTLAEVFGFDASLINRIQTRDLNQKAPRPLNSSFDLSKLRNEIGIELGGIKEGLKKLKKQLQSASPGRGAKS